MVLLVKAIADRRAIHYDPEISELFSLEGDSEVKDRVLIKLTAIKTKVEDIGAENLSAYEQAANELFGFLQDQTSVEIGNLITEADDIDVFTTAYFKGMGSMEMAEAVHLISKVRLPNVGYMHAADFVGDLVHALKQYYMPADFSIIKRGSEGVTQKLLQYETQIRNALGKARYMGGGVDEVRDIIQKARHNEVGKYARELKEEIMVEVKRFKGKGPSHRIS